MSEETKPELLPCPFCGSNNVAISRGFASTIKWGYCRDCDTEARAFTTAEDAAKFWNTRAFVWIELPKDASSAK